MRWLAARPVEEWEQPDDPRVAAGLASGNVLAFTAAESFGLMDLLGLTLALALLFLAAGYLVWDRGQKRTAVALAGANVLAFAAAESFGLLDLLGLTLALALLFLAAGFVVWERERKRTAAALAAGTLPFWLMLLFVL